MAGVDHDVALADGEPSTRELAFRRLAWKVCALGAVVVPVAFVVTQRSMLQLPGNAALTIGFALAAVLLRRNDVPLDRVLESLVAIIVVVMAGDVLVHVIDGDVDPVRLPFVWVSSGALAMVLVEFAMEVRRRRPAVLVVSVVWLSMLVAVVQRGPAPGDAALAAVYVVATAILVDAIGRRRHHLHVERDVVAAEARLARLDSLTGLPNRRGAMERLVEIAGSPGGGVVMVDLDRFKAVNDEHGHDVGDHVLIATARAMQAVVRDDTDVARWGGEEFLVVVPDTTHEQLEAVAERLRRAVAGARGPVAVTASVGVATCRGDGDVDDVLRRADQALYTAKREGRDRVVVAEA